MSSKDGKRKKPGTKGKRKAPGLMSFVVWRQFFMVLGAPGIATAVATLYDAQDNFIPVLIGVAVPSLVHGQLWKWTFDWAGRGATVMRNLRFGQIALGLIHSALCSWALAQVALGAVPYEGASFYHGLTLAGLAAGLWETLRPALELRDPPEVKEAAERKRRRAAKKQAEAAQAGAAPSTDDGEGAPTSDTLTVSIEITPGMQPMDRGGVEDELCEALQAAGATAEVTGGGTMMGEVPVSDFDVDVSGMSAEAIATLCRQVLGGMDFTQPTTLSIRVGDAPAETVNAGPAAS